MIQLPEAWQPKVVDRLVRVGPAEDGGYVLSAESLDGVRTLISCGLFDDWRFEQDFQQHTGCEIDCYDPTVTPKFWLKRYYAYLKSVPGGSLPVSVFKRYFEFRHYFDGKTVRHHRLWIGYPGDGATDLASLLVGRPAASTFLKIDIEGSEYRVLGDLIDQQQTITGFVIEFHDVDVHADHITRFIAAAKPWFDVVHVHINNYLGCAPSGLPLAIELSFARAVPGAAASTAPYPLAGLDCPSNPAASDPPFAFAAAHATVGERIAS